MGAIIICRGMGVLRVLLRVTVGLKTLYVPAYRKHIGKTSGGFQPYSCPKDNAKLSLSLIHISEPTRPEPI
eukprot:2406073-Pyramimonas_sp.AAC.1